MRIAVTIAEGLKGNWDLLATPKINVHDQIAAFKKLKLSEGDGKYKQCLVLTSSGTVKRTQFKTQKPKAEKPKAEKE